MCVRIIGTGSYIPKKVITNDDLAKKIDTSDEWITTRTGIKKRHIAEDMRTSEMATIACKEAISNSGITANDIDVIIVATSSPDYAFPNTAALIQRNIGATNAACFDISVACSGFIYAYSIANAYIKSGMYKNILLVGAEIMSKQVDWNDRSVCVLFGDGAGAVVVTRDDDNLSEVTVRSNGNGADCLISGKDNIYMDGQEVFKFAVKTVPQSISEVLSMANCEASDIKFFVLHQANKRIIEAISKRFKADISKFPMNLSEYGNTSAASIPILLDELNRSGKLLRKDKIVISGFGAGLSYGSIVVEW